MKAKTQIIISLIIGLSILGCSLTDYVYKKQALNKKIEEEEMARTLQQINRDNYEDCVATVHKTNNSWWEKECQRLGRIEDCALPMYLANHIEENKRAEIEDCYKLYLK